MKTALTIAGSDSSGGAGIQADIKTMTANGVFAMSAITALTAQNTTGVTGIFETTPEFLAQQLDAVFTDIYPDAIKIGMVSSSALIETIAKKLRQYDAKHIVVDPVMVATSGAKLLQDDAVQALTEKLLPLAQQILRLAAEATHICGNTAPEGLVRIAIAESLASWEFHSRFKDFHEKYPGIRLKIIATSTDEMFQMLGQNQVDIVYTLDRRIFNHNYVTCLLYTSDAADD